MKWKRTLYSNAIVVWNSAKPDREHNVASASPSCNVGYYKTGLIAGPLFITQHPVSHELLPI